MSIPICSNCGGQTWDRVHSDSECFKVIRRRVEALAARLQDVVFATSIEQPPDKPVVSGIPTAEVMYETVRNFADEGEITICFGQDFCRIGDTARRCFYALHNLIASRVVVQKPVTTNKIPNIVCRKCWQCTPEICEPCYTDALYCESAKTIGSVPPVVTDSPDAGQGVGALGLANEVGRRGRK